MRYIVLFVFISFCIQTRGQDCDIQFSSPVKFETRLSGSFGEPRTRHFHAGIDYKLKRGIPYDSIFAVADGYISRINVQPDGYGNALYISHDCNKTSVYAHLYTFSKDVEIYMRDTLVALRTHSINHRPQPDQFVVAKGDFIGIMGSTGRSSGPHLHFEIRMLKVDAVHSK